MLSFRILLLLLPLLEGVVCYRCEDISSKEVQGTCVVKGMTLLSTEAITNASFLPSATRHSTTLRLEDGNVANFSLALARKLANVKDLTVDGMGIRELVVWPSWEHLSAKNNSIAVLGPAGALVDADQCQLRTLHLEQNALTRVPPFGRRFRQLRVLALDDNRLESVSLDSFVHLEQLQTLSLAGNRLIEVVAGESGSPKMLKLNFFSLARNRLMDLQVSGWEMGSLQSLDLSGNGLYLLDAAELAHFPSLKELRYAGNDWSCVFLSVMQRYLHEKNITVTDREPDGRCEQEHLMTLKGVCCYEEAAKEFSPDLYSDRWEQLSGLQRRYDLVQFEYDKIQASDLNVIVERAHGLRATLTGTVTSEQDALEGGLSRLRASVAHEMERTERLSASIARDLSAVQQSIAELYQHATRPKPTLDAIVQESLAASIGHIEKNVKQWQRRIREHVADFMRNEKLIRELDDRIASFNESLAKQTEQDEQLNKQVASIELEVAALIRLLDSRPKEPPSGGPDSVERAIEWPSPYRFGRSRLSS